MDQKLDSEEINERYIIAVFGPHGCGPLGAGQPVYYRNRHRTWRIRIFIDHHWDYNGQEVHYPQEYVLEPNPDAQLDIPNALDVLMGCTINVTGQRVYWDLVRAERA